MNAVPTISRPARAVPPGPPAAPREFLDLVSRYQGALTPHPTDFRRKAIAEDEAPSNRERAELEARLQLLKGWLVPATAAELRVVIPGLMSGWPGYGEGLESAGNLLGLMCRALDDVPLWAVQEACLRFIKGKARTPWDPAKAPTPPQVRAEAMREVLEAGIEAEIVRLEEVLGAEVEAAAVSESGRADALARWDVLKREIAAGAAPDDPKRSARVEQLEANRRLAARDHAHQARTGGDASRRFGDVALSPGLAETLAELAALHRPVVR